MLIRLTAFSGSKPSASYFKRDFYGANLNQKVPRFFEQFQGKKAPARPDRLCRSLINVEISRILSHIRDKCLSTTKRCPDKGIAAKRCLAGCIYPAFCYIFFLT